MGTALRVEWRKVVSTRIWWVLLLVMVAYVAAISAFLAVAFTVGGDGTAADAATDGGPVDAGAARVLYTLALPLGYVFPALLGILGITTEYRHKTITSTLLGETRRPLVLLAKAVVVLAVGLVYAVVGIATSTGAAAAVLAATGESTFLGDGAVLGSIARGVVGLCLWALIGLAFGLVLRNQIAAIVVLLAFSQLVEPIARLGLAAFEATSSVAKFLPGAAADALTGVSLFSATASSPDLLTSAQGGLVLLAYAAVLGVVGGVGFSRRDVA